MPAKRSARFAKAAKPAKVQVRTPNVPGYTGNVDAAKYAAMRKIVLKVIPRAAPGVTQSELFTAIRATKPEAVFPNSTAMWWGKCVQLDLEAQGVLKRDGGKPLRWRRVD